MGPFLQPVEVPLDGSTTLGRISHSSQLCITCKLAEDMLCPISQVINEDVEKDWPQYWFLGYSATYWPPTGLRAMDHNLLGPAIQPVFSSCYRPLTEPVLYLLVKEDIMAVSKAFLKSR